MANLKVFVSSTCYDLNIIRSQLRDFIISYGFEPIMSDYSDVLYNPKNHTHESCINEVEHGDMLIVIIGSRFGGTAVPKAREIVNLDDLKSISKETKFLDECKEMSITQLEVLRAIELGIPIFPFIQDDVKHDHNLYEKNKDKEEIINQIHFPSIQKKGTEKYVFEFINFLRLRTNNNAIESFSRLDDIQSHLRKQWSGLFQRLLHEQKFRKADERRYESLSSQLEDLKTALITSIESPQLKVAAQGAVKYRRMLEFLLKLSKSNKNSLLLETDFDSMMGSIGVKDLIDIDEYNGDERLMYISKLIEPLKIDTIDRLHRIRTIILMENGSLYALSVRKERIIDDIKFDWNGFIKESKTTREALIDAKLSTELSEFMWLWCILDNDLGD
ncbi:DUF4062 domain-containing protein [Peribacillus frigoritolerans]|uniref:DUF4062 domain-containing protein n=1 Tax=Peribacillus frigoritolerans TaxID=450367 RepID=UPI0039A0D33A